MVSDLTRNTDVRKAEDSVYAISAIPAIIIATAFALYYSFFRLSYVYPLGSSFNAVLWDVLPYLIVPGLILCPLSFSITFEFVYRIKMKTDLQTKRLVGRVIIQLATVTIFVAVYLLFLVFLLPLTPASLTLVAVSLVFSLLVYAVMKRFKKTFIKLEKGEW